MDNTVLLSIIAALFSAIIGYITKKQTNQTNAENKLLKNMVYEMQGDITALQASEKNNKCEHEFRFRIKTSIIEKAGIKINESEISSSGKAVESALTDYFNELTDFALIFFYSTMRTDPKITQSDFKKYLYNGLNSMMYKLLNVLNKGVTEVKGFTFGRSFVPIIFVDWFCPKKDDKYDFPINEILVNRLVINNIDYDELQKIFVNYTSEFIEYYKYKLKEFNKMKNYEDELEKRIN